MDCYNVCPEPCIKGFFTVDQNKLYWQDCITCGRCIDVCAENVFTFGSRFEKQIKLKIFNYLMEWIS